MKDPLQELLENVTKDPEFAKKLEDDPDSLRAEGKLPAGLSSFELRASRSKSNCGSECGCMANSGAGCPTKGTGYCCDSNGGDAYN